MHRIATFVFTLGSLVPAAAHAQTASSAPPAAACRGGRVASELTLWRCCWPGQVWNDERARCSGPPICPPDLEAQGDECLADRTDRAGESATARIARGIEEDRARAAHPARLPYTGGPVPPGYRLVQGGSGLRTAGGVLLVLSVPAAVMTGIYGLAAGGTSAPLGYALVPVVGMPLSVFECGYSLCNMSGAGFLAYAVGGWFVSAFQLTGAILALVGANARPTLVRDARTDIARWRISPWIGGSSVGIVVTTM